MEAAEHEAALEVEATACTNLEVEATGLTSSLSSTRIRLARGGPTLDTPRQGGGVGVIETKGETLLTASAKGDNSGSEESSKEALRFSPLRVFTILNTWIYYH